MWKIALALSSVPATIAHTPSVAAAVDKLTGIYTISVDGKKWYESSDLATVCVAGKRVGLQISGSTTTSGNDKFGDWIGTTASYATASSNAIVVEYTFKSYAANPQIMVGTASFPNGLDTSNCGKNTDLSTNFPAINTTAALGPSLHTVSWRGGVIATTAAAKGLGK
jgi:hypothetical protein